MQTRENHLILDFICFSSPCGYATRPQMPLNEYYDDIIRLKFQGLCCQWPSVWDLWASGIFKLCYPVENPLLNGFEYKIIEAGHVHTRNNHGNILEYVFGPHTTIKQNSSISVPILAQASHFGYRFVGESDSILFISLFLHPMEIWFESFAGSLGKLWRQNRRKLKPGIRGAFAQLLLEVRAEMLPTTCPSIPSGQGQAKLDVRGIPKVLQHIKNRQDTCAPGSSSHVDRGRRLEAIALRRGIGDLEAKITKMTLQHQSQMAHLRSKLGNSADAMQHGLSSLTEHMAKQANCLTKAFQVNRVIPNDAPV